MKLGYNEIRSAIFASSCVMGDNIFIKLIDSFQPITNSIEIGTYRGISTITIASMSEKVYTFDVEYQSITKELWEVCQVKNKIDYNIIKDVSEIKTIVKDTEIDFAFVDALHTRYGFLKQVFNMLQKMGIKKMLFDGVMDRFPVSQQFANELQMEIFNDRYGYWEAK